jgi:4-hydroxyacetophenone monooxygenase
MSLSPEIQPIAETDAQLRAILDDPGADLPPLLPALAYALGDTSLLPGDLQLDPARLLEEQGGWTDEEQQRCRELGLNALIRLRDDGPASELDDTHLGAIMNWLTGVELTGSYVPMLTEELAPADRDLRAPDWHKADIAPDRDFAVAIVGAGMSGILTAYRLHQAGVSFVVLEKNDGIGGTWLENTYPGCRVDVSNHVYCYSFMQKHDWPQFHSAQGDLLKYFNDCVDLFEIRDNIRFGTEVDSVVWEDTSNTWTLDLRTASGDQTLKVNAVVSAVGQLNRPQLPAIEGRESFAGPAWHSARWNHDVDLTGKRVGVIGTGCSAMQLIPHVAAVAAEVTVFQRTPNWLMPRPQYTMDLPDNLMWLFTHVPHFHNWFRLRLFWRSHEGLLPRLKVDPDWPEPHEISISAGNDELRAMLTAYLKAEFADAPDLQDQVIPQYTMGAKRFVIDNGEWARALKQDHVELCTDAIERIDETGVIAGDGQQREFDVLIYGTGFQASSFLTPMKVVGRDGLDLHDAWDGNARAYLGIVSPSFPNFFYMYGPNTNIVINGSIIYFSECETHYITQCVRHLLETGAAALDVRQEIHDLYNDWIDEGNRKMAWGISSVSSWYKTNGGRVAQNWPYSLLEYWDQTRDIQPDDYEVLS